MTKLQAVVTAEAFKKKLFDVCVSAKKLLCDVDDLALVSKGKTFVATHQQLISSVNMQNAVSQLLYSVIIDHCVKADRVGPGSFFFVLDAVTTHVISQHKNEFPSVAVLKEASYVPSLSELSEFISSYLKTELLSQMFLEAIQLSGVEGRIFVEKASGQKASVERLNGFNFSVTLPVPLAGMRKHVRCVVIDGVIESVAEVHHLFQVVSDSHEPLLLVCRGVSDDVVHTVKVNSARKTLDVVLAVVKYDFEGLNVLNDIAIVCQTDVVSSMKGQLISTIDFQSLPVVSSVTCSDSQISIANDNAVSRAKVQIAHLMQKRREAPIEQFQSIFDDRIKSLSASSVRIRVVGDKSLSEFTEKLDVVLRLVRSTLKHGFFSKGRMRTSGSFLERFPDPVPFDTVLLSVVYTKRCIETLQQLDAIIV